MAFTRIILWLGNSILFCAMMMALTGAAGLGLREFTMSSIFAFLAFGAALLGGVLVFSTRHAASKENTTDALVFLLLFWIFTPAILALPFVLSGASSDWVNAYFEAVSAFTTTGASTLAPEELPRTLLIWRSLLQWCGGVTASTFAIVILAALNLSGTGVHRSKLFTLKRGELFPRLLAIGRIVAVIYAGIAAVCFVVLLVSGTGLVDAACLAMSAISTGGLTPQSGAMAGYVSRFGALILAITCLFGAANVAVLWDFVRLKNIRSIKRVVTNLEHRSALILIIVMLVFALFYAGLPNAYTSLVESAYMISTTGFDYEVIGIDMIPPSVLIIFALIGGSAISTAGGIKLIRFILLLKHASTDIDRMSHPSRVKLVHFRGQVLPDGAFLSIWMYFFGYTIVFAAGTLALGAAGMSYTTSVAASASALSNMGPLLDSTFPLSPYSGMSSLQLSILSLVMLAGRIEVLAALAAFSPSLWRR